MTGLAIRLRYWMRFLARMSYRTDLPLVIHALRHRRYYALPADLWDLIEPLPGFLNASEAGLLYWAAHHWPVPGSVIELGSFGGRSTIVLASSGRHVHAVDAWGADSVHDPALKDVNLSAMFEQFQANVRRAGIESQVTAHRGSTWDVARDWHTPGALLFVDAGHEYAMVKGDLERWCPHLMRGGLLLMHDALGDSFLGVTRAAAELLQQGWVVTACAGCLVALVRK